MVVWLIKLVVFNDPIKNCRINGWRSDWDGLPKSKSLFFASANKGLPIGNLTSQLFANIYLSDFDYFVKGGLKIRYYGRYVDDMVFVHKDKEYLKAIVPLVRKVLQFNLGLKLHSHKVYLQHFSRGLKFLGVIIKPYRIYICNRIKGNFYRKIMIFNNKLEKNNIGRAEKEKFVFVVNSYLGLFEHYQSGKLCGRLLDLAVLNPVPRTKHETF